MTKKFSLLLVLGVLSACGDSKSDVKPQAVGTVANTSVSSTGVKTKPASVCGESAVLIQSIATVQKISTKSYQDHYITEGSFTNVINNVAVLKNLDGTIVSQGNAFDSSKAPTFAVDLQKGILVLENDKSLPLKKIEELNPRLVTYEVTITDEIKKSTMQSVKSRLNSVNDICSMESSRAIITIDLNAGTIESRSDIYSRVKTNGDLASINLKTFDTYAIIH